MRLLVKRSMIITSELPLVLVPDSPCIDLVAVAAFCINISPDRNVLTSTTSLKVRTT